MVKMHSHEVEMTTTMVEWCMWDLQGLWDTRKSSPGCSGKLHHMVLIFTARSGRTTPSFLDTGKESCLKKIW